MQNRRLSLRPTMAFWVVICGMAAIPATTSAEGSAEVGSNQRLRSNTELFVDILNAGEQISWTGNGTIDVFDPANNWVSTLSSGSFYTTLTTGTYYLDVNSNQSGAWDVSVSGTAAGSGRLFAYEWFYNTGSYAESLSAYGSYYAIVLGGNASNQGVVELDLEGLSGYEYSIGANATGVNGSNAGFSVSTSGNSFDADFKLYLKPPENASYTTLTPTVADFAFSGGPAGCNQIAPGSGNDGSFTFTTNVEGTYNLICDTNQDTIFNRVDSGDTLLIGTTSIGSNSVTWDGLDNTGSPVASGTYDCIVVINVGEFHYVGRDIETSFEGLRLFGVDGSLTRTGLDMFWNDSLVQSNALIMDNSEYGLETSGVSGINSGDYVDAADANVNARAWGDWASNGKGNGAYLDTYGSLKSVASTSIDFEAVDGATDTDSDTIPDIEEECITGTDPDLWDTDGDGTSDADESGGGYTDTDGDGTPDGADDDKDNDGITDDVDTAPLDPDICADSDSDGCDDCAVGSDDFGALSDNFPNNDGADNESDGLCDAGDPDDDNDGVLDGDDDEPFNANVCSDDDSDGCEDCVSGSYAPGNDGQDSDGDGICDAGEDTDGDGIDDTSDLDDDDDGIPDTAENDLALDPDGDADSDGIPNWIDADDRGDGSPATCADVNTDEICDSADAAYDKDGDGVPNHLDLDADNDGIFDVIEAGHDEADSDSDGILDCAGGVGTNGLCDALETSADAGTVDYNSDASGPDDERDTDSDGLADFLDVDSDNDGIDDLTEGGSGCADSSPADNRCDGSDSDGDGLVDDIDGDGGFGDDTQAAPTDSDSDGTADFRSLDADGDTIADIVEGESGCVDTTPADDRCDGPDADDDGIADDATATTPDYDSDSRDDYQDIDSDNDGLLDSVETTEDTDGDTVPDYHDLDSDDDGIPDVIEGSSGCADTTPRNGICDGSDGDGDGRDDTATNDTPPDTDGDGAADFRDLDADNDGIDDITEGGGLCADTGPNSVCDGPDGDDDGIADDITLTEPPDSDGDGVADFRDLDADNDGLPDIEEGASGCADANRNAVCDSPDSDGDGIADSIDDDAGFGDGAGSTTIPPNTDATDGADYIDTDSDDDSTPDLHPNCTDTTPADDRCDGDDSDDDGVVDDIDGFDGFGVYPDTDGDGANDDVDLDDDNDGIPDSDEGIGVDTDSDGIPDASDLDSDNDGILDIVEAGHDGLDANGDGVLDCAGGFGSNGLCDAVEDSADSGTLGYPIRDTDSDGVDDFQDLDSDDDAISDLIEGGSGCSDSLVPRGVCDGDDADDDGITDGIDNTDGFGKGGYPAPPDSDSDGTPDYRDLDSDGDGIFDVDESSVPEDADGDGRVDGSDTDGDGIKDRADDSDDDGISDEDDSDPGSYGGAPPALDSDNDGTPDYLDDDSDGDGTPDDDEAGDNPADPTDTDEDGIPDFQDPDSDDDGINDDIDNCVTTPNQDQADPDEDGIGEACDDSETGGYTLRGGGCMTTSSGGTWLVLVLLAVFSLRRRRAALGMTTLIVVMLAGSVDTHAQNSVATDYPAERFRLATDRQGILDVEWGTVARHLEFDLGLWVGYANDPLNIYTTEDNERVASLVSSRIGANLIGSIGLFDKFQVGLALPLIVSQDSDTGDLMMVGGISGFGLGDIRVIPKYGILRQAEHGISLAVTAGFTLPTATSNDYGGDSGFAFQPELVASRSWPAGWRVAGNIGYHARKATSAFDLQVDDELTLRTGVGYRFMNRHKVPIELDLTFAMTTRANDVFGTINSNYSEVKFGAVYDVPGPVIVFAATGVGTSQGFGTPDWRLVSGLRFQRSKAAPLPATPLIGDRDKDGIRDDVDKCPKRPETKNNWEDDDGCPDVVGDADKDGINDLVDGCPKKPEDKDGFKDDDGCPDNDNDADGIADADDKCRDVPGGSIMAGCPDPDRDNDTVVDRIDNCPDEPGEPQFQGCKQKQLVTITDRGLSIVDIVYFRTNKAIILKKSYPLLDNVAAVLNKHKHILKIRIEGHTDDRGSDKHNLKLSQRRANAVMAYLIKKGVEAQRLEAKGYGETRPVADNGTDKGRSTNRRVDFTITGGDKDIKTENTGPSLETMDGNPGS